MATNESLKEQLAKRNGRKPAENGNGEPITLKALLASPKVKKRFEEVLDKRAPQFMTSIINLYSNDPGLQKCDPMTVISSAMVAASLDLPIDKNLGYAWIVPYGTKAQFQLGYKGYIQLALRTGQYKNINVIEVYEGELIKWNRLTEEIELDFEQRKSDKIIGYVGYFELINGFEKTVYWSKEEIEAHRKKFSKSDFGWKNNYDAMAKKTVLRNMLSKWGILSVDMQKAYVADVAEPSENANEEIEDIEIVEGDFEDIEEAEETTESENGQQEFDVE